MLTAGAPRSRLTSPNSENDTDYHYIWVRHQIPRRGGGHETRPYGESVRDQAIRRMRRQTSRRSGGYGTRPRESQDARADHTGESMRDQPTRRGGGRDDRSHGESEDARADHTKAWRTRHQISRRIGTIRLGLAAARMPPQSVPKSQNTPHRRFRDTPSRTPSKALIRESAVLQGSAESGSVPISTSIVSRKFGGRSSRPQNLTGRRVAIWGQEASVHPAARQCIVLGHG